MVEVHHGGHETSVSQMLLKASLLNAGFLNVHLLNKLLSTIMGQNKPWNNQNYWWGIQFLPAWRYEQAGLHMIICLLLIISYRISVFVSYFEIWQYFEQRGAFGVGTFATSEQNLLFLSCFCAGNDIFCSLVSCIKSALLVLYWCNTKLLEMKR